MLPQLIRDLQLGPEDPYWFGQQTAGYEAALYVGTIPLILVFLAVSRRPASRATLPWQIRDPVSFALATMPRGGRKVILRLLALPGFGYFRVPARYTLLDEPGPGRPGRRGVRSVDLEGAVPPGLWPPIVFAACAVGRGRRSGRCGPTCIFGRWSAECRAGSSGAASPGRARWRRSVAWRSAGSAPGHLVVVAAVELGILFYHGTTEWGWAIAAPRAEPRPDRAGPPLAARPGRRRDREPAGPARIENGHPYLGFAHRTAQPGAPAAAGAAASRRCRRSTTGLAGSRTPRSNDGSGAGGSRIWSARIRRFSTLGKNLGHWHDPALDRSGRARARSSRRLATGRSSSWTSRSRKRGPRRKPTRAASLGDLLSRFTREDDLDIAWFLAEDDVPGVPTPSRPALVSWDGTTATVEHDGTCDLVIARSFDPGWTARINDGPEQRVLPRRRRIPGRAARRDRGTRPGRPAVSPAGLAGTWRDLVVVGRRGDPGAALSLAGRVWRGTSSPRAAPITG